MEKELMVKFLQALLNSLIEMGSFTVDQAPLIMQDVLRYAIIKGTIVSLVGVFLTLIGIKSLINLFKERNEDYIPVVIMSLVPGVFLFIYNVLTTLQALFSPRLYLIEFVRGML